MQGRLTTGIGSQGRRPASKLAADSRGLSGDAVGPLPVGMKRPGAPREQPPPSPEAQAAGTAPLSLSLPLPPSLPLLPLLSPSPPRHTHHGERAFFRRRGAAASALRAGAFRGTSSAGAPSGAGRAGAPQCRCHREGAATQHSGLRAGMKPGQVLDNILATAKVVALATEIMGLQLPVSLR